MRILCLNLQQTQEASCAEIFLKYSPRVQFRFPHYVFLDVESTAGLFGGEAQILKKAVETARLFAPTSTGAIADAASVAQVLVNFRPFEITKTGDDLKMLSKLPVLALAELEGLEPWPKKRPIENMSHFFQSLGMDWIEDLLHFQQASFRERWGEFGVLVWKRIHGQDFQVVSPLIPQDPLMGYGYFDDPVSDLEILSQRMFPQLQYLFLRLEALGKFAQRVEVTLFCEYSEKKHQMSIEPVAPNRDLQLFHDLIKKKMEKVEFANPVREFEIYIYDLPEKVQQLDFFEPRDSSEDRWRRLISFARQAEVEMGFLQIESSHLPEESFSFQTEWPKDFSPQDLVEWSEDAIQVKSVYAKGLAESPRPSLLLKEPLSLTKAMMAKMKMLTRFPTERIQSSWWKKVKERDYYFALSNEGQLLWVYQDLANEKYFLHGYFD